MWNNFYAARRFRRISPNLAGKGVNDMKKTYQKPTVVSYSEKELLASVEAFGPSLGGGP